MFPMRWHLEADSFCSGKPFSNPTRTSRTYPGTVCCAIDAETLREVMWGGISPTQGALLAVVHREALALPWSQIC